MLFYTGQIIKDLSEIEKLHFAEINLTQNVSAFLKKNRPENHNTCIAINTALNLLAENKYEHINTVCTIIKKVCQSCFTNLNSDMYGIIPYDWDDTEDYYREPDYDSQVNIISVLLEIYIEFEEILPAEITSLISNTCIATAFILSYIPGKVDSYNSILELISLIYIGEKFDKPEILNAGIQRLQTLLYFTLYNNALMEYNHPDRILRSIQGIIFFRKHIKNHDYHSGIQSIENIIFTCFYTHFNPKLMIWTGPISVIYGSALNLSKRQTDQIRKITNQNNIENLKIPEEYRDVSPATGNKFIQILTSRGFTYPYLKFDLVASSYNTGTFALGSFNHDDMWGVRKPCLGFFGTKQSPYMLSVQCLINNHDFASGAFHSVQYKSSLLGHIGFSTNRGNHTIISDCSPTYKMSDLRIRFNIEGDASGLEYSKKGNTLTVQYNQLSIYYQVQYAAFDDYEIKYELNALKNSLSFDVILYSGEETELELAKVQKAITAFSIFMDTNKKYEMPEILTSETDEMFISECKLNNFPIKIESPKKPGGIEYVFLRDRQYINNMRLEEYTNRTTMLKGQHRFLSRSSSASSQKIPIYSGNEVSAFTKRINNLENQKPENLLSAVRKITNGMTDISFNIAQRYSIQVLINLFKAISKYDVRFENIIEKKYSQVYDKISYATKISKIKSILTETAAAIEAEYKKLQQNTKKTENIKKIIDIINSEYKNPNLSLQHISSRIGQSEAHLSREFHTTIGQSYAKYLLKVRIEKAKELLENGKNPKHAMEECGYSNFHTFNAAFKRYTGTTAKKYIGEAMNSN